jgi:iron complex outermembrane receptor protein
LHLCTSITSSKFALKKYFLFLLSCLNFPLVSQTISKELPEVVVQSFEKKRSLFSNPDALQIVDSIRFKLNSNQSFVPVLNTTAGVKMEERSPGSYRLAIRGSSLRAPFGVRNVKIYWNQIPLTDAGNNTYFQIIDPELFQQALVIKGPSGGLYGAGTGGTLLLSSPTYNQHLIANQHHYNSLGGYKQSWDIQLGKSIQQQHRIFASYTHQKGYREQSDVEKLFLHYQYHQNFGNSGSLDFLSYYGNLSYQTPGGLTLAQFVANPKQARPGAGTSKGAIDQKATFYLNTFQAALSVANQWNEHWAYRLSAGYQQNDIKNPTIRNYEIRNEPNFHSRGVLQYKSRSNWGNFSTDLGYEFLSGDFNSQTFQNNLGEKGNLQIEQNAHIQQYTYFVQSDLQTQNNWYLTLSGSINHLATGIQSSETIFSPRFSLVKKFNTHHSLMAKIAHGFSPPSIAEIRPSTSVLNPDLKAEKGWNHEISYRGQFAKINWDATMYWFELQESISLRRTADGADYFVNVGNTRQKGLELSINYLASKRFSIHSASTFQDFKFVNYTAGSTNYAGNQLTGTAPYSQSFFAQAKISKNITLMPQFLFTDKLFLNDANTDQLPAYRYWNLKANFDQVFGKKIFSLWLNLDNLMDERNVSGPDLNAVGGRYYNPSAGRNFTIGTRIQW